MTKSTAATEAFALAKEIRILMGELLEKLNEVGKDDSLSTQQRHLVMKQVCDYASDRNSVVEGYAKNYLDNNVEKVANLRVEGVDLGDEYVAGMVYNYKPTHKVEILNGDDASWGQLIVALVNAGYASAIQKRLTPSHFVGERGEAALHAAAGMIACSTDGSWSITKPKPTKG